MRKEYDLKNLKIKRKGPLPELAGSSLEHAKIRITIALDRDIVEYYKMEANEPGSLPYQTQINQALRMLLPNSREHIAFYKKIKDELLHDKKFLLSLQKIFQKAS